MKGKVKCPDCDGTGAEKPDCWLCDGDMTLPVSHAVAEGYKEEHLDIEGDRCLCPAEGCYGDSCAFCDGDGWRDQQEIETEITRVLICGLTDRIPCTPYRTGYGRVHWNTHNLLSNSAGIACEKHGWIRIFRDIFGHSITLTPAGRAEAERRLPDWMARFDVTLGPVDDDGRWGTDGGPVYEQRDIY